MYDAVTTMLLEGYATGFVTMMRGSYKEIQVGLRQRMHAPELAACAAITTARVIDVALQAVPRKERG